MRTLGLVAVLLAGCGRLAFDARQDSGGSDGDGSVTSCGPFADPSAGSFTDDFSSGTLAPGWAIVGSCIDETGGELVSTPPSNMNNAYCFVWTAGAYHLSCDSIAVRVPEVTQPILGAQTFIYLEPEDQSRQYAVILEDGGFDTHLNGAGNFFPYEPTSAAWWRLSEAAGQLIFSISPDGETWTTLESGPEPFPLDNINVGLGAGTYMPVANPGQAAFHCYNVPPPCN